MNAEKIIKKAKIAIVNKYYVSFDDVKLLEYRNRYTFTHDLVFYIEKLNKYGIKWDRGPRGLTDILSKDLNL